MMRELKKAIRIYRYFRNYKLYLILSLFTFACGTISSVIYAFTGALYAQNHLYILISIFSSELWFDCYGSDFMLSSNMRKKLLTLYPAVTTTCINFILSTIAFLLYGIGISRIPSAQENAMAGLLPIHLALFVAALMVSVAHYSTKALFLTAALLFGVCILPPVFNLLQLTGNTHYSVSLPQLPFPAIMAIGYGIILLSGAIQYLILMKTYYKPLAGYIQKKYNRH